MLSQPSDRFAMGAAASSSAHKNETPTPTEKVVSRSIDRELAREKLEMANTFKILLLGGSESGKTTIFKQMRILHLDGFTRADKINYRYQIFSNAVDALNQLVEACQKFRIVHENAIQGYVRDFLKFRAQTNKDRIDYELKPEMADKMHRIWISGPLQMAYKRRFEFPLLDSAKYFLDSLMRISEKDYMPSAQDILQCRYRTTGIHEISFKYKELGFRMVDVGGQKSERRKWIHCFDNVNMVLFIIAMSDYDLMDPEETSQNRLLQNLDIFKTIVQSEYFRKASIALFMNKHDIFVEKLKHTSLKLCWPNYTGDNSTEDACEFITQQFQKHMPDKKKFFAFATNATDTRNIDLVFGSAVAHIVDQNLKATGLQE